MKKSLRMMLALFTLALGVLFAGAANSKAAQTWDANIKQTEAGTKSATIQWNGYIGSTAVGHYHVLYSTDNVNFGPVAEWFYGHDCTYEIDSLPSNSSYYVKVVAMTESSCTWSEEMVIAESTSARIATLPELGTVQNLRQTSADANSISIAWDALAGATSYSVYKYNSWNSYDLVATTTATSFKISGLSPSYKSDYFVIANAKNAAGFTATSKEFDRKEMRTVPAKISYVSMTNYWDSLKEAKYGWNSVNNADGYQFQLLNYKGKSLLTKETLSDYIYVSPFKKGIFTKARARAYIVVNNKKIYGAWSNYSWNAANKKVTARRSRNGKKITVNWKKISGCAGYTIYISTKSDSGFKKVKTLSSKKKSITIKKCGKKKLKKNKTYYYRVVYLTKEGKKKVASKVMATGSI